MRCVAIDEAAYAIAPSKGPLLVKSPPVERMTPPLPTRVGLKFIQLTKQRLKQLLNDLTHGTRPASTSNSLVMKGATWR